MYVKTNAMRKYIYLTVLAVFAFVGVASAQQFPNVEVENQKGATISTRTLVDGKTPFIVTFWDTTCKPCVKELDALAENMPDWLEEANFRVIAVSVDDSRSSARAKSLAAGRGWTAELTMLYDKNQNFKRALNVSLTPTVFVFDKTGKMVYTHTGYTPGGEYELFKKVKALK